MSNEMHRHFIQILPESIKCLSKMIHLISIGYSFNSAVIKTINLKKLTLTPCL